MLSIKNFDPIDELYILVQWPFVQELMEHDCFNTERFLHQALENQEYLDSVYFVPVSRLQQIQTTA